MLLKELTEAFGPTGFEDEVRGIVRRELDAMGLSVRTDVLGNVIASTGEHHPGPRVMLDAHMDEVGLMVTHIGEGREEGGLLRFRPLGGVDPRVLVSKPVLIGERRIPGVIGSKPVHLQQPSEREKPIPMEKLYIDIGARDARRQAPREAGRPGGVRHRVRRASAPHGIGEVVRRSRRLLHPARGAAPVEGCSAGVWRVYRAGGNRSARRTCGRVPD